jgi:hypothetical protein
MTVFPPSGDDSIEVTDYFTKHCEAFLAALDDKSVDICVQAIPGVCDAVSIFYDQIPDVYVDKIFNKLAALAKDNKFEIRAAVYHVSFFEVGSFVYVCIFRVFATFSDAPRAF